MLSRLRNLLGIETRANNWTLATLDQLLGQGATTAAGLAISPATASRCAPWAAARRVNAGAVSSLPCHVFARTAAGRERTKDHPAAAILSRGPNPWLSTAEWFAAGTTDLMDHGNHVCVATRVNGRLAEVLPVPFTAVDIEGDPFSGPRYFVRLQNGERREYPADEVLHVRLPGQRPWIGQSMIEQCKEAIGLALVLEVYAAGLFGRGARPAGVLKIPGRTTEEQLKRIRAMFSQAYAGGSNAGKVLIMDAEQVFEPHQMTSTDAQFLELRAYQVAEISRVTGVPLPLLSELERATHANAESLGRQYLTFGLMPLLKLWQSALNRALFTEEERDTYFCEFETNALVAADISARFDAYTKAVTNGILSPNEARARENLPPFDGGDAFRAALNTGTIQPTPATPPEAAP